MGLLALSTAAFTDVTTDLLPAGLLPQMSGSLHVPQARARLLVGAFAVASALAAIPVTAALRGLPRRPVLQCVLAGFALLDAVTAVSPWYPLTFAARLLAGVMGGALWSMLAGYAARMVPAAQRGRPGRHHRGAVRRHPGRSGAGRRARLAGRLRPAGGPGAAARALGPRPGSRPARRAPGPPAQPARPAAPARAAPGGDRARRA